MNRNSTFKDKVSSIRLERWFFDICVQQERRLGFRWVDKETLWMVASSGPALTVGGPFLSKVDRLQEA